MAQIHPILDWSVQQRNELSKELPVLDRQARGNCRLRMAGRREGS